MYDSDFHSFSLYLIWHYLIHPGGSFCRSSVFPFLQLLFCLFVQNLQLCPHSLQVFLFYLSWAMILNLSSVSSRRWLETADKHFTLQTGSMILERHFSFTGLHTHTHMDIQRWFSLTCDSNIKTLYWPFIVVAFEQFNPKDNKNRGWFIHIHSV